MNFLFYTCALTTTPFPRYRLHCIPWAWLCCVVFASALVFSLISLVISALRFDSERVSFDFFVFKIILFLLALISSFICPLSPQCTATIVLPDSSHVHCPSTCVAMPHTQVFVMAMTSLTGKKRVWWTDQCPLPPERSMGNTQTLWLYYFIWQKRFRRKIIWDIPGGTNIITRVLIKRWHTI